jgi:hypothetical protein
VYDEHGMPTDALVESWAIENDHRDQQPPDHEEEETMTETIITTPPSGPEADAEPAEAVLDEVLHALTIPVLDVGQQIRLAIAQATLAAGWDGTDAEMAAAVLSLAYAIEHGTPQPAPVSVPDAYVNADDGYRWLHCTTCDQPLTEVDGGAPLATLVAAAISHTCEATA